MQAAWPKSHIFIHGPTKQLAFRQLKEQTDALAQGLQIHTLCTYIDTIHQHGTLGWTQQAIEVLHQRGFARTVDAYNGYTASSRNLQGDIE